MKIVGLAGLAMTGALLAGGANAQAFSDYVNVQVPGQQAVTFTSFNDTTGPETFVGTTAIPLGFIPGTVILTEPNGTFSDWLTILRNTTGGLTIFFFSDPEVAPPVDILSNQMTITETGKVQDVSSFFGPNITVQVGSDLDRAIPEPATWTMMLVGVGMAGAMMRTRRTVKAAR